MRINLIYIIILSLLLVSCFTGVEHTGKITLPAESKTEKQSPEDAFIGSYFVPQGCDSWRIGKTFYYTDDKLSVVFQAEPPIDSQGQKAAQRQQIQHPGVLSPGLGDKGQGVVKTRPQKSPYNADKDTQGAPFEQGFSIFFRMMKCFNQ